MEQTKERSRWAGRLEVVLVMAAGEVFFIAAHYISIQPYYIWRFLLLAVLPLAVIPSHPFAYMGFTRKKIGKQLLFGLLTAVILYLVFAIPSQLILFQLYRPEGYRLILEPRFPHMTSGEIVKQAVLLIISSAPEEIFVPWLFSKPPFLFYRFQARPRGHSGRPFWNGTLFKLLAGHFHPSGLHPSRQYGSFWFRSRMVLSL